MKALIEKNLISGVRITTDAGQERMSIPGATDHLIGLSRAQRVEVMVKYHRWSASFARLEWPCRC